MVASPCLELGSVLAWNLERPDVYSGSRREVKDVGTVGKGIEEVSTLAERVSKQLADEVVVGAMHHDAASIEPVRKREDTGVLGAA